MPRPRILRLTVRRRLDVGNDLADDLRGGPAVEQQVVEPPDHVDPVVGETDGHHPRHRGVAQHQAGRPLVGRQRLEPFTHLPVVGRLTAPVEYLEGDVDRRRHDLDRIVEALPHEHGAQHRMTPEGGLPGAQDRVGFDRADEVEADLLEVERRIGVDEGLVQDPGLRRRERQDVVDVVGQHPLDVASIPAGATT